MTDDQAEDVPILQGSLGCLWEKFLSALSHFTSLHPPCLGELNLPVPQLMKLREEAERKEEEYRTTVQRIRDGSSASAVHRHTVKNNKILARERIRCVYMYQSSLSLSTDLKNRIL